MGDFRSRSGGHLPENFFPGEKRDIAHLIGRLLLVDKCPEGTVQLVQDQVPPNLITMGLRSLS